MLEIDEWVLDANGHAEQAIASRRNLFMYTYRQISVAMAIDVTPSPPVWTAR